MAAVATRSRGSAIGKMSVSEIQFELKRRERELGTLVKRRNRLASNVASLDSRIRTLGGRVANNGRVEIGVRRRPKNDVNLVQALAQVLKGRTMSVTTVSEAVQKAGYRTTSPSFRTIVNQALINHDNKFKRISRGQYTAK